MMDRGVREVETRKGDTIRNVNEIFCAIWGGEVGEGPKVPRGLSTWQAP